MNLDRVFIKMVMLSLPVLLLAGACKKKKEFQEENGQTSEDIRNVQGQNDEAVKDINVAIMEQPLMRGRGASEEGTTLAKTELCGVDIDTLDVYSGITRLHYNGLPCNGIKKTGDILVTIMGYPLKKWKHKGCVLKIDFLAYKITRADGRTVQCDGTEYLTNESGNTWYEMRYLNAGTLVQSHIATELRVTYGVNSTAVFNFNRQLSYTYSKDNVTTCTLQGLGSSNGVENLDNWGLNRDGDSFTTQVVSPVIWKSTCGSTAPIDGELKTKLDTKDFEMDCKFGVDSEGNSVAADAACPSGWKLSWSYKKKTNTRIFPYN